jgi:hypothetical protein
MFGLLKNTHLLGSALICLTFVLLGAGCFLTNTAASAARKAAAGQTALSPAACLKAMAEQAHKAAADAPLVSGAALEDAMLGLVSLEDGGLSLRLPLACLVTALLLLGIGVGLILYGDAFGMVLDANTGCASLSRAQAMVWTAVVMGGYTVMTLFNLLFGANYGMASAQPIDLYPALDADLLILLGIVAISPMAATRLSREAPKGDCKTAIAPTSAFKRFAQLFSDDAAKDSPPLTISRMQCVIMTIVLGACYLAFIMQTVCIVAPDTLKAAYEKRAYFERLPEVGGSFLLLLGASHAVFQASKSSFIEKYFTK